MNTVVNHGLWIASGLLLFVVALIRFNRPPTNRTGTTFLLFYTGVLFYYALLIGLWLLVIILISAGGYGIDGISAAVAQSLKANEWLNPALPVIGFLVITVASQFKLVGKMDTGARQFCIQLAAIPAEAEQLAVELAHGELQLTDRTLIENISREISTNIGGNALRLTNDGSLASRFTRAVSLYWLFIMPDNAGTPLPFPTNVHGRSAYTRIMRLNEKAVEQSVALYDSLMENGLACFTSSKPTRAMEDALKKNIQDLSLTVCRLIARWVLYLEVTENQRRKRLSSMGLNPRDHSPAFGRDQWVASILAIIILFLFMSIVVPGKQPFSQTFMYSVLMAIQLGMAVIAGTAVAQRFIRRQEENIWQFPPLAELTLSALVVVGLCIVLRVGWPLVPDLLNTGHVSLSQSLNARVQAAPVCQQVFDDAQHAGRERIGSRRKDARQLGAQETQPLPHRDSALQQEGADLIDDARALTDKPLAHPVQRLQVELVGRLGCDELHGWALHRLGDRFRIAIVVLLTFGIRAHILCRHQPRVMTKCL